MKKKFPRWATTTVNETISYNGENEIVQNMNEGVLSETLMDTGFLKDMYMTSTNFNTLIHLICYYLNRPERFENNLPDATDPKYAGRVVQLFSNNQLTLLFSNGAVWRPIKFADEQ